MKYFNNSSVFHFSWDQVAASFWQRYPNPHATHVLSEDTISRSLIDGKLYSYKLLRKTNKCPKWGEFIVPANIKSVFVVEESIVDPIKKTFTTYTRNMGLSRIMNIDEKCVYSQSPENRGWTQVTREAWISSSMYGLGSTLQAFGYERFKKNANKAIHGLDYILHRMYVPPDIVTVQEQPNTISSKAEKFKNTARKAKELAKSKAGPMVASVAGGTTAS